MSHPQVTVKFTFDLGLLHMKRDYVVPILHEAAMSAFVEAQKKAGPDLSFTVEVALPSEGNYSILNKCMEEGQ